MDSVKELLRHMIERMSDAEARQLLEFAQHLRHRGDDSLTLKRLAADPAFIVPENEVGAFRVMKPVQGQGIAASKLLVDDRR
jgi:hypothetical protein